MSRSAPGPSPAPEVVGQAAPYAGGDGRVGVLFCHGFTGSPQSMLGWALATEAAGYRVVLPRLPGHGTSWQEMNQTGWRDWYAAIDRAFVQLRAECDVVFVAGLSMGGGLALVLAENHGDEIAGLALVNPSVGSLARSMRLVPLLRRVLPSLASIASDIAKPQTREGGYDRTPLHAVAELMLLWRHVAPRLAEVTQPLLMFRSLTDHVVDPSSGRRIMAEVGSTDITERLLERSYHVATLDYDADVIITETLEFFGRLLTARGVPLPVPTVVTAGAR